MTPRERAEKITHWFLSQVIGILNPDKEHSLLSCKIESEIQAAYDEGKKDGSNETWEQATKMVVKNLLKIMEKGGSVSDLNLLDNVMLILTKNSAHRW